MQLKRGNHRDSKNQDDYKKIIKLRQYELEVCEYIQQDPLNKVIKKILKT